MNMGKGQERSERQLRTQANVATKKADVVTKKSQKNVIFLRTAVNSLWK